MLAISLTPYVGVAPSTTTMALGAAERRKMWWNPYVDLPTLRGLGQTKTRWDLFALAFGASLASAVGYAYWRGRK